MTILSIMQKSVDYPVINNFYSTISKQAFAVNLGILDESLSIIQSSIPKDQSPSSQTINGLRKAISKYLGSLKEEYYK